MTELFLQARQWMERLRERVGEIRAAGGGRGGPEAAETLNAPEWGSGEPEEKAACCRGGETLPTAF